MWSSMGVWGLFDQNFVFGVRDDTQQGRKMGEGDPGKTMVRVLVCGWGWIVPCE